MVFIDIAPRCLVIGLVDVRDDPSIDLSRQRQVMDFWAIDNLQAKYEIGKKTSYVNRKGYGVSYPLISSPCPIRDTNTSVWIVLAPKDVMLWYFVERHPFL